MAHEADLQGPERETQRLDVLDPSLPSVVVGPRGLAVAAHVQCDHAIADGEGRREAIEDVGLRAEPMEEHEGRPRGATMVDVVELQAVERDGYVARLSEGSGSDVDDQS